MSTCIGGRVMGVVERGFAELELESVVIARSSVAPDSWVTLGDVYTHWEHPYF